MKNKRKDYFLSSDISSYKDIVNKCNELDINLKDVVTYDHTWNDEDNFKLFEEKIGTVMFEHDERCSDGDHDSWLCIISVGENTSKIYMGVYGYYTSYNGSNFDDYDVEEMRPYQKVINDWETI